MPEPIKMVKFKTNVSFVASNGVLYFGGQVVQLPQADFDAQVEVCTDFGLPTPKLIEEVEVAVQEDTPPAEPEQPVEPKKRGRGRSTAKSEGESEGESEAKPEEDGEL